MVRIRGQMCALGEHSMQDNGQHVRDPNLRAFIRKRNKDFRSESLVCGKCLRMMKHIFDYKMSRALRLQRRQSLTVSSTSTSGVDEYDKIVYHNAGFRGFVRSDASGNKQQSKTSEGKENKSPTVPLAVTSQSSSSSPNVVAATSEEAAVRQIRRHSIASKHVTADDDVASDDSHATSNIRLSLPNQHKVMPTANKRTSLQKTMPIVIPSQTSISTEEDAPTTSAAAAAREAERQRRRRALAGKHVTIDRPPVTADDDLASDDFAPSPNAQNDRPPAVSSESSWSTLDEVPTTSAAAASREAERQRRRHAKVGKGIADNTNEFEPSPNALNGTRLPHVQPILKRRQPDRAAFNPLMDIYLLGINGG